VDECAGAADALQLQNFDAVVLGPDIERQKLSALAQRVQELNRRSTVRTALLGVASENLPDQAGAGMDSELPAGLDAYLPDQATPEALTAVLIKLSVRFGSSNGSEGDRPELPVLDVEGLKDQVAFDDELLIELIDLYCEERKRQSSGMRQALEHGDLGGLSRLAHTIKGSLGNLHAPAARMVAQLLELAALNANRASCEELLPDFEHKLDLLEAELQALKAALVETR
jgi:HPt (histidine-containing phosphotransfer) domain-containing protein